MWVGWNGVVSVLRLNGSVEGKRRVPNKKQPSLSERVSKLVEGLEREVAAFDRLPGVAARGRHEAYSDVLAQLKNEAPYRGIIGRDKIRFLALQLAGKARVPSDPDTAEFTEEMYAAIAYKQLASKVKFLLSALPEDDEEGEGKH